MTKVDTVTVIYLPASYESKVSSYQWQSPMVCSTSWIHMQPIYSVYSIGMYEYVGILRKL